MIHFYHAKEGLLARFESADLAMAALGKVLWIDMVFPTAEEEDLLERALKIDIPTREDMQEIEMSSRVYNEAGALFLTASVLSLPNGRDPIIAPVTFVLAEGRLVTVRYHAPRSFETFVEQSMKVPMGCGTGAAVLIALFETIVARLADILEAESRALDELSKSVFATTGQRARGAASLAEVLTKIGRTEDLNAKARDSLATIDRLTGYLAQIAPQSKGEEKVRVKTLARDLRSLSEYAAVHGNKITFLLDATLGMINIDQNKILGIFSIVAFVFLPPTLIASIYGMNFDVMPELQWVWGYPLALVLMLLSAVLPYMFFRRRGWL